VLARLTKTLGTHAAITGLALLVLGAGGAGLTLAAADQAAPGLAVAEAAKAKPHPSPTATDAAETEAPETPEVEQTPGARPTDTHGYCVSQVAQNAPTAHSGEGADKVTHGTLVRAAAQACGKETEAPAAPAAPSATSEPSAEARTNPHGKAVGNGKAKPNRAAQR